MFEELHKKITQYIDSEKDKFKAINNIRKLLHVLSPNKSMPVDYVQWIPIDKIKANDYNPNSVASKEMQLLYTSIDHDGYTQPIVTIYDKIKDEYVIVDGFHRYFICKQKKDIQEKTHGMLPIVVIDKEINDRMSSTIRHNRARGKHNVSGMSKMVFSMLDNGWKDDEICNELGMEAEELLRLKHITGFSKLFKNVEYSKAWVKKNQIRLAKEQGQEVL